MAQPSPPIALPCQALRPFVERYAVVRSTSNAPYTVLPGTGLVMGFQFSGAVKRMEPYGSRKLHRSGVTGMQGSAVTFQSEAGTGTVLVFFREAGATAFFPEPLNELFGQSLSLEQFMLRSELVLLEERLEEAATDAGRVSVVEAFLIERLRPAKPDALVVGALALIHRSKGSIRIEQLAEQLHTSRSPLERRFRKAVGATAKQYAGIVRMRAVLQAHVPGTALLDTALEAGFYDQAHFIKTFRAFTGEAPQRFFEQAEE
ncbi:MAG: helix-turn-helix transcriptional regulator [Flavobacteriales bacterium]|nr:MAG: helix-turn-helix transcriptional regulator [Flavobacteriales bacterium]